MRCVDLNVGSSEASEFRNFLAQNRSDIGQERFEGRIGSAGIFRRPEICPQAGTGKRDLGNAVGFDFEV